ncbi:hypothetical protein N9242_01020 [Vicingaceae bacterium]|nr:hypothetical protein [Vicingaceae bacterium]
MADDSHKEQLPDLPHGLTSLGAANIDGKIFVYGGNLGDSHTYSKEGQNGTLYQLDLNAAKDGWKKVGEGPRLQGLAMVAVDGQLIRIGGFSATNEAGEEQNLVSTNEVARFNFESANWDKLAPLPEPRSSFDAVVVGKSVFVIGGWKLKTGTDSVWHETAWKYDLADEDPKWVELSKPPFVCRANSVSHQDGKIFVVGGMKQRGGPTTDVHVYDIAEDSWSEGPALPGQPMEGFGNSSFHMLGSVYVSTHDGNLYKLDEKKSAWKKTKQLERGRFFHRMIPYDEKQLVLLGGTNRSDGKLKQVDVVSTVAEEATTDK